ncbi:tRNA pseudouridine32 synthase/23S rRNA pseudouridine746 synthase [Neisseria perflava]|uniref:TIGR01621 family pseudouridine synthase n=1 Tax=Neisseria perflava TaxID=33053 RepID=UPI00209C84B0|nr:TIGR01621 family pseudouridine synthase [Neisseria perflava]MCP1771467.1 tRNA pseudouridine32 synthase/23S rRNA pseudouridine746 synthase [Neisseria perflava]
MLDIIFKNQFIVAINKSPGIAVHQETEGLTKILAKQLGVPQVWLLHRLDKLTSGVLLFALDVKTASLLSQQFAEKTIKKTYLALTDQKPTKKQGWVKGGMQKSRRGTWKLTRDTENFAVTRFCSHSLSPNLRLFVLHPYTGKTHQLRVAMKSLSAPILGDSLYGGSPSERLFLHAWKIEFDYAGEHFVIEAPYDTEWPSEKMAAVLSI